MLELIQPAHRNASALRARFAGASPFPHLVLEDFLATDACAQLEREFPEFDPRRAVNELGYTGGKAVFQKVRDVGPQWAQFDDLMKSTEFLDWLGNATGFEGLLYDPDYVGGGGHLNSNGQELDLHVDFNYHPRTRTHRRLNLILFLNSRWDESWGGCLELRREPDSDEDLVSVLPLANRCVIFETSEHSWHGFQKIAMPDELAHLGRRSIAVYFYTKDRPADQIAPSHGTFYMPRPLPARYQPGHTLSTEDVYELQVLLARRDQQIRYLYEREKDFSKALASPVVRAAHTATAPLRWLRRLLSK